MSQGSRVETKLRKQLIGKLGPGNQSPGKVPKNPIFRDGYRGVGFLQPQKKENLNSILTKEEIRAKNDRTSHILCQRLASKYGHKHLPIIQFYVEDLVDGKTSNVTANEIENVEELIQKAIKTTKNASKLQASGANSLRRDDSLANNNGNRNGDNAPENNDNTADNEKKSTKFNPPPGSEWLAIMTYQNIVGEQKSKEEQAKLRNNKKQFKEMLQSHQDVAKGLQDDETADVQKYMEHIMNDIEKFKEEEKLKQEEINRKHQEQLMFQIEQIQETKRLNEIRRKEDEDVDLRNIEIAKAELAAEEEKIKKMRERDIERRKVVEKENERNKQLRLEHKKWLAEEDQRLAKEAAEKADREQEARDNAFQKRMDEMAKYGTKFAEEGAGKKEAEARKAEERLLIMEIKRKEDRDEACERKKKQDAKERTRLELMENDRQLREKAEAKKRLAEEEAQFKIRFIKENAEYQQSLKNDRIKDKQKRAAYMAMLKEQNEEFQRGDKNLKGCTKHEQQMNKVIFDDINKDPELIEQIMTRMQLASPKKEKNLK